TSFLTGGGSLLGTVQQPMGQRTTYTTPRHTPGTVIINPLGARTTMQALSGPPTGSLDPFGSQTQYQWDTGFSQQLLAVTDAAGVRTSFSYQLLNNGAYSLATVRKTGYNSGTGQGQYAFSYNSNSQVQAVVDE